MSPHDAPLNVLIVDDDREMRDSLTQYLTKSGCVAEACPSAPDALSALRTNRPDVLVSDVRMPGMTGIDLLGQLDTDNIALPVVLITAHGDVSMAVEAMRAGAFDFIEKPFQPSRLLDVVQRAAEVGRLRADFPLRKSERFVRPPDRLVRLANFFPKVNQCPGRRSPDPGDRPRPAWHPRCNGPRQRTDVDQNLVSDGRQK